MRRRDFITLLGGTAAAWPLRVEAQQPATPVIGFVSSSNASPDSAATLLGGFREGLQKTGYVEGRNLAIEYRWTGGRSDLLPERLADLVRHRVALIVASGGFVSAMAAKAATNSIPILFVAGFDPIKVGLVTSFSRPSGNATGVSVLSIELAQKRLELLLEVVPKANPIALLVNPNPYGSALEIEYMGVATHDRGLRLLVLKASADSDFDPAFRSAIEQRAGALVVSADPFFTPRRAQIVALAARHKLPTIYPWREYVDVGGLMSYGTTLKWAYEEIGEYAGRILKGAKPSDLPVKFPKEFDMVVNLKTTRALGLDVPRLTLARTKIFVD